MSTKSLSNKPSIYLEEHGKFVVYYRGAYQQVDSIAHGLYVASKMLESKKQDYDIMKSYFKMIISCIFVAIAIGYLIRDTL